MIDCVSDDADDTSAGTGARTIFIQGLDADYDELTEVLIMNGLTPVQSVNTYMRIFRTQNITAGATEWNEGMDSAAYGGHEHLVRLFRDWGATGWNAGMCGIMYLLNI